jgi:hypothetical protein
MQMEKSLEEYTMLVYRKDKRFITGERLFGKYEYLGEEKWMQEEVKDLQFKLFPKDSFRIEVHKTYVEKVNLMTGVKYLERFDTPHCCSPSTETYWSA